VILKHMKRVTFLCPSMTTGGPEAIHQASQVLNQQGLISDIAYYGRGASLTVDNGRLVCVPPSDNPCLSAYAEYEPATCTSALLRPHHLIVLPEVLAGHFSGFGRSTVAVWWLSVDNALQAVDDVGRRAMLADRTIKHLHQSAYAADYLRRVGVPVSHPLGDFTTGEFTAFVPSAPNPEPVVAYNPAKGADLAAAFFAANPHQVGTPIQGMSRVETAEVMRRTMLYVDFGHLPGKDRLPREAAASGAVVFLRDQGAGHYHDDFPVPDFFRFSEDDVVSGDLVRRIDEVQADPQPFWAQQETLRKAIRSERDELGQQVRQLRGRGGQAA
jgi:hypothetical protein